MATDVTTRTVVSYTAFPPLLADANISICIPPSGISLLHYLGSHLHRPLAGILPCEARTFLTCVLSELAAAVIYPTHALINLLLFCRVVKFLTAPCIYTLKQLPPTNSRQMEFLGRSSAFIPTKYSRNLRSLLASRYSGASFGILNKSGSAYCFIIASS